jgi:hypothetical protein
MEKRTFQMSGNVMLIARLFVFLQGSGVSILWAVHDVDQYMATSASWIFTTLVPWDD